MLNVDPRGALYRVVAAVCGVAMIGVGIAQLVVHGDASYTNWFGGLVFAPLSIAGGIFTVVCAVLKPAWLASQTAFADKYGILASVAD